MPPAAVDGVDEGGAGEAEGAVAKGVDAMLDDDGEVLVATEVGCPGAADFEQGALAAGLGPAVAVEVGEQALVATAVHVDGTAEGGGGEHAFHFCALAVVLAPLVEEGFLAFAEEFEAGEIDGFGIVGGVVDVVGAGAHLGDFASGAAFEFAVFEDGEVDTAKEHAGEINGDIASHVCGIDGVW